MPDITPDHLHELFNPGSQYAPAARPYYTSWIPVGEEYWNVPLNNSTPADIPRLMQARSIRPNAGLLTPAASAPMSSNNPAEDVDIMQPMKEKSLDEWLAAYQCDAVEFLGTPASGFGTPTGEEPSRNHSLVGLSQIQYVENQPPASGFHLGQTPTAVADPPPTAARREPSHLVDLPGPTPGTSTLMLPVTAPPPPRSGKTTGGRRKPKPEDFDFKTAREALDVVTRVKKRGRPSDSDISREIAARLYLQSQP